MPTSLRENDADVLSFVRDERIKTVLDVGAGAGTYGRLLAGATASGGLAAITVDAIEVWAPYVEEYRLRDLYRDVHVRDVRELAAADLALGETLPGEWVVTYDLIVFGDVLEHMTAAEADAVWRWAKGISRWGLISVPVVHWPQGPEHGNPYEVHVQDHLTVEGVRQGFGPFEREHVYGQTATFVARF